MGLGMTPALPIIVAVMMIVRAKMRVGTIVLWPTCADSMMLIANMMVL